MEPPSPDLLQALHSLELASPRDLRRAFARCRRLAIDLPTFDTVWIDALVSLRLITRFQANHLEGGRPEALHFGPYLLVDRLSCRPEGATFLARKIGEKSLCVLKGLAVELGAEEELKGRFGRLTSSISQVNSRRVVIPHLLIRSKGGNYGTVSRFVGIRTARQELIRSGRFDTEHVIRIAHQLLCGVGEIHSFGVIHGDIGLENVRLTASGDAVLVDAGFRGLLPNCETIHGSNHPEEVEGRAPETIGFHAQRDAASDIYSLGCLLWHLLAGRAPFVGGDPLAVLVAHRSNALPDIRDFASDVPDALANAIREMTRLDPADRPSDLMQLDRMIQGQSSLRAGAKPRNARYRKRLPPIVSGACAGLVLFAASLWLYQADSAVDLQASSAIPKHVSNQLNLTEVRASFGLSQLPKPDSQGVIQLEHAGPYAATDIQIQGGLTIRGNEGRPAEIIISDRPLYLRADEVALEHIKVTHGSTKTATGPSALLLVEAQNLSACSCRFDGSENASAGQPSAVGWRLIDRADPTAGKITFENCICRSLRELVYSADAPRMLSIKNALIVDGKRVASLRSTRGSTHVSLERLTVRDAETILSVGTSEAAGNLNVVSQDSIFETATLHSPPDASVIWRASSVLMSLREGTQRVTNLTEKGNAPAEMNRTNGSYPDGFLPAMISFRGPSLGTIGASEARITGVPRRAGQTFGVDVSRLPSAAADRHTPR